MRVDRYDSCCSWGRSSPPTNNPAASCAYNLSSVLLQLPAQMHKSKQTEEGLKLSKNKGIGCV